MPRPRISFGKIALRMGAITSRELDLARRVRAEKGGSLEAILLEKGALTREMALAVREAFVRACAVCPQCGRRTDAEQRDPRDFACRCGGEFVPLDAQPEVEDEGIDPQAIEEELLESEPGDVESDAGDLAGD